MGVTHVTTQVSDLNKTGESYEAEFLVGTGAIDCMAPRDALERVVIRKLENLGFVVDPVSKQLKRLAAKPLK